MLAIWWLVQERVLVWGCWTFLNLEQQERACWTFVAIIIMMKIISFVCCPYCWIIVEEGRIDQTMEKWLNQDQRTHGHFLTLIRNQRVLQEYQPEAGWALNKQFGGLLDKNFSNAFTVVQEEPAWPKADVHKKYLKDNNCSHSAILKFCAFLEGMIREFSKETDRSRLWHAFPCRHAVAGFTCQIPEETPVSLHHPRFVTIVQQKRKEQAGESWQWLMKVMQKKKKS